jgi:hypothetical protein
MSSSKRVRVAPSQALFWVFTQNNFLTTELKFPDSVQYAVWTHEHGVGTAENPTGTPHLQGYVEMKKKITMAGMCKLLPKTSFQVRKGTQAQARDYCMKQDSTYRAGPWEHGVFEATAQGERSDLVLFKDAVKDGATNEYLVDNHLEVLAKYPRLAPFIRSVYAKPRDPKTQTTINVYWGAPRTGKTRKAEEDWIAAGVKFYVKNNETFHWWDNYKGEEYVIIDEFDKIEPEDQQVYLQILDRRQCQVAGKGTGFVPMLATNFILTANTHPSGWWPKARAQTRLGISERIREAIGDVWHFTAKIHNKDGSLVDPSPMVKEAPDTNSSI